MTRVLLLACCLLGLATPLAAEPGKPVAVRWWGHGMVSIETWWNLRVVINPHREQVGSGPPNLNGDLVLVTHEHFDHNSEDSVKGKPVVVRGLAEDGSLALVDRTLDRLPGADRPTWNESSARIARSRHAVRVQNVGARHDNRQGGDRGAVSIFIVEADGVRIVLTGELGEAELSPEQVKKIGRVDVLCLPVSGVHTIDGRRPTKIIEQLRPRYVVPLHDKADRQKIELDTIEPFVASVGDRYEIDRPKGNTLAVSAADGDDETRTRVTILGREPWTPAGELAELMERMERACRSSQQVFARLSAEQLNWRPPDGTHTPRWNAEHLMGRQLGFFSQIYAAIDPEIEAINLNPQQMPDDYRAAHPEWGGDEQARQMERSAALVRRFAYLLDGVNLDKRAPGSRWTLRRLLLQMERHFEQHTANTEKKFGLEGWPGGR